MSKQSIVDYLNSKECTVDERKEVFEWAALRMPKLILGDTIPIPTLPPLAATGPWQPIETAPKDGETVLLLIEFREKRQTLTACWKKHTHDWYFENAYFEINSNIITPLAWAEILPPTPEQIEEWTNERKETK